jgi:hypothetical protein
MNGVVPKFNMNIRRAFEYSLIHLVRLIRAAPNSTKRIINRDFIGASEILDGFSHRDVQNPYPWSRLRVNESRSSGVQAHS